MTKLPLLAVVRDWLGFGPPDSSLPGGGHSMHSHHGDKGHGHTHGVIDPEIAATAEGISAIKWSFVILAITAAFQLVIVIASGSVALLADTIHNFGDAVTAIPLWIAFLLARRKPSLRFTYGYGRAEDFAGVSIVFIILASALVAAYEAIDRLIHPHTIDHLGWIVLAGMIGFIGNESVAIFRIRTGRKINSAALIADGYHARTDGMTSLAVVVGAAGVYLGFPLADPIIGLLITVAIFAIVWQSGNAVFTRMLDGVEPEIIAEIRHAAGHVAEICRVIDVRARWLGHRLQAELDIAVDGNASVTEANAIADKFESELFEHMPALAAARIRVRPYDASSMPDAIGQHGHGAGHHHAPAPVAVRGELAEGMVEIIDTPAGERMRFTATRCVAGLEVITRIERAGNRVEELVMLASPSNPDLFLSDAAPEEPHEFSACLVLKITDRTEALAFSVVEPAGHADHH